MEPKRPIRIEVVLGFPNRYPVGMSNLGFQAIYSLLNGLEGVRCERTFLWETAGSGTLESGRPLSRYPLVAFSVPFELDYLHLLEILRRARISLLAKERRETDPLIQVGGPCAFLNPEPLAPFVDLFVAGEGEMVLPSLMDILQTAGSKEAFLGASARLPGVYVPHLYRVSYFDDGRIQSIRHQPPAPPRIKRQWVPHLSACQTLSPITTPLSHFKNMCMIEVQRGCAYRCRFCAMGSIYRPLRHRSLNALSSQIKQARIRGERIGLVGSAAADLPGLEELCLLLSPSGEGIGISSLRADRLTPSLIRKLGQLGMQTITIAPEVGSERMRRVIDKKVTPHDVLETATLAAKAGIPKLKLYFIIGLPGEGEEDLLAILALVQKVTQVSNLQAITVSASAFVPKAATPFQWAPMNSEKVLRQKMRLLAEGVKRLGGVTFAGESPRLSLWQGLLAMGDRRLGMVMWHRQVEGLTWNRALRKAGLDRDFYVHRERSFQEILPWDIIDHGITKKRLWDEYLKAKQVMG